MATHSSVLAWRIPGTGEPGGLPSMGSHRVGHHWSNAAAAATYRQKMHYLFLIKTQMKQNTKSRDELLCHLQNLHVNTYTHNHSFRLIHTYLAWIIGQTCRHLTWLPFASCISLKLHSLIKDQHIMNVRIHGSMTLEFQTSWVNTVGWECMCPLWPSGLCTSCSLGHLWQPLYILPRPLLHLQYPAQATPLPREATL